MPQPAGVQALVRRTHEDRVLQVLREHGGLTRSELSAHIGLSRTTLSEITAALLARGVISVSTPTEQVVGRGRPAETLRLDPAAGQYIGVDFRHSVVRVAVANAARELIASDVAGYDGTEGWEGRIAVALQLIEEMPRRHGVHLSSVLGVAVGLPGPFSPRVPRDESEPIVEARRAGAELVRAAFRDRFGTEVILDNNTRLAALAEAAWRPSEGVGHLLYIRLSYGIGGGLVIDGRLVAGSTGLAGEFGHLQVSDATTPCRCGKRGCLETIASIDAILGGCRDAGVPVASLADVEDAAAKGDPLVLGVLRNAGSAVGKVLGSLAVALNPAEIVIGGEVAMASDVIVTQVAETVTYELLPVGQYGPLIRRTDLGDEGGAIGGIIALLRRTPLLTDYPNSTASDTPPRAMTRRTPTMTAPASRGGR
ncbi:ROK family transcriptional regulator [Microbacterium sp. KUDC0406]|uniref:ROK family transcriptional regulator n=1 Tax=Microbacterium sp. KUDC0406 TaxID=2909588 RepID=UPI001F274F71|nr:ROK family transcriptional regulator [Microbacterium sp. KUDC0406]UJP09616.1 ROK family transcriptional regulator [Microbacterium sp. KUDC0406]